MGKTRRTFTREFKVEAVKLVTEQGRSFSEAAANLGIAESLLRKGKQNSMPKSTRPSPARATGQPSKRSYAASAPRTSGYRWNATF